MNLAVLALCRARPFRGTIQQYRAGRYSHHAGANRRRAGAFLGRRTNQAKRFPLLRLRAIASEDAESRLSSTRGLFYKNSL